MEKISSFRITELTVSGFKCFTESQTFKFGDMNSITGHNGQGKSSIADAIAYTITGAPFFGSESSLDRLYTLGTREVSAELTLELADGSTHKLARARVNDHTTITYDGIPARQSDLNAMFGERDVFLSILNPLYFVEVLGEKGRNLLERYLPAVQHERVLTRLCESHRQLLAKEPPHAPEYLLEQVRKEIREMESEVIYTEGQRDLLISQNTESGEALTQKQAELTTAEEAIAGFEAKKLEGELLQLLQQDFDELTSQRDQLSQNMLALPDTSQLDAAIQAAGQELAQKRAAVYISPYTQEIAEAGVRFAAVKKQYEKEKGILDGIKPGKRCSFCKQLVTEQNIGTVKQAFIVSINAIIAEGHELKKQLVELQGLDNKAKELFDQSKAAETAGLAQHLHEMEGRRSALLQNVQQSSGERSAVLAELDEKIRLRKLAIDYGELNIDEIAELDALRQKKEFLLAEISSLDTLPASVSPGDKVTEIQDLKQNISEKRDLENAIQFYIAERVKLMFADFDTLQRVKVELYDVVKRTGEVKNVFRFSYDGKPYHFLSLSEKIKAGLEISELMKRLAGVDYPVFIDNGESVPVIDNIRPSGQVFISQVVKAAPLTVRVLDNSAAGEKKLAA